METKNLSNKYTDQEVNDVVELAKRFISSLEMAQANRHVYQSLIIGVQNQDKYLVDAAMEYREVFRTGIGMLEGSRFFNV
jgi:hypothetical protein